MTMQEKLTETEIKLKRMIASNNKLREQLETIKALNLAYYTLLKEHDIPLGHEGLVTRRAQMELAKSQAIATGSMVKI